MPTNLQRIVPLVFLLLPVLLAVLAVLLGVPVEGRDDINYLAELERRPYLVASPDQLSWIALKAASALFSDKLLGLRLAGFLICLTTCFVLLSKRAGTQALTYFLLSIAPLYWILYFNQVRTGIAIAIFLFLFMRGRRWIAPVGGALAHLSSLVLLFPPALIIAPFTLDLAQLVDPSSFAAVRFAAYADFDYLLMPWYFGWELVALALVFATEKKYARAMGVIVYAVAVRLLADRVSVDVARRLLEIGLFAYSPVIIYLKTRQAPSVQMVGFFVFLGAISVYAAIAGGVVTIGA